MSTKNTWAKWKIAILIIAFLFSLVEFTGTLSLGSFVLNFYWPVVLVIFILFINAIKELKNKK